MGDQVTTTATTRETQVTADEAVVYETSELDGAGYVVVPHPPTPRDGEDRQP
jgi:hypothetical protein